MQRISKPLIVAFVLSLLLCIVSSVAFGWLDGRWVDQPNLTAVGKKIFAVPEKFGHWSLVEDQQLADNAQNMLRCYGSSVRLYQNANDGSRVTVAVLFGPRGPIAVHTPEICYSGQGVQAHRERKRVEIESGKGKHSFWQIELLSQVDQQPALESLYAWSNGTEWQAAEQPRFWLTDRLYKLQIAGPPRVDAQDSACEQFLRDYLQYLQPLLVKSDSSIVSSWLADGRP